jgi:hypothetical protein
VAAAALMFGYLDKIVAHQQAQLHVQGHGHRHIGEE